MIDAHNHLHDARLAPWRADFLRGLPALGVRCSVVNGTREEDWPDVAALAREAPWVHPSFGLHPWYVRERSPEWLSKLRAQLDAHPGSGVGEIGLDRWVEHYDWPAQQECFAAQLNLATELDRPVTIHCLQAWGALLETLRARGPAARGFLLHAYGGPAEMVAELAKLGAYFSFSTYFLHERKGKQREVFTVIPAERLLVETDAPDMAPPPGSHELPGSLNHPANIERAYEALAQLRGITINELSARMAENFATWFGS